MRVGHQTRVQEPKSRSNSGRSCLLNPLRIHIVPLGSNVDDYDLWVVVSGLCDISGVITDVSAPGSNGERLNDELRFPEDDRARSGAASVV